MPSGVELDDHRVHAGPAVRGRARKIGGVGVAGEVDGAGGVYGDAVTIVRAGAAQA